MPSGCRQDETFPIDLSFRDASSQSLQIFEPYTAFYRLDHYSLADSTLIGPQPASKASGDRWQYEFMMGTNWKDGWFEILLSDYRMAFGHCSGCCLRCSMTFDLDRLYNF